MQELGLYFVGIDILGDYLVEVNVTSPTCVQEINKETVAQLEDALAAEKSARAELTANLIAAAAVNQAAIDRRNNLETQVSALERAMAEQARTDDEYKEWSDTTLPSGVAGRLRRS